MDFPVGSHYPLAHTYQLFCDGTSSRAGRVHHGFGPSSCTLAVDYITNQIRVNRAAAGYPWRANVWKARKEFDIAIADYNQAIRLDPGTSWPRLMKALVRLTTGREEVVADARSAIEADAWKGTSPIYAAIVGHLGARRVKQDGAARQFLDDADHQADKGLWPYPIVRYLRHQSDEHDLLAQATDTDKMTEARCYLAFDQLLRGGTQEARGNFLWVKDHGTPGFRGN